MNIRQPAAFAAAVALSLGLAACGESQTVAEGCKSAVKTIESATGDLTTTEYDENNPEATKKAIDKIVASVAEAEDETENAEVKDAVGDFKTALEGFPDMMDRAREAEASGDDETKAEAKAELEQFQKDFEESSSRFRQLCEDSTS